MKVKCVKINDEFSDGYQGVTIGNIYDCEQIRKWGSAVIIDDEGEESMLALGEYEVIEQ